MYLLERIWGLTCVVLGFIFGCGWALLSLPLYACNYYWGQVCHHAFGKTCLFMMNIRVKTFGLENLPPRGKGAVLAPNHESMMDIPLLSSLPTDFRWISKEQVGKIPFIGQSMRMMGCYFLRRNRSEHDLNVMKEVEDGLKAGNAVLIFPEGTRTRTGKLLPFKKGAFKCAQNTGVPIIPIAISGTYEIAPPGTLPTRGHNVTVRIGKPISIPKGKDLTEFIQEYRGILTKLLSEDRGPSYDSEP